MANEVGWGWTETFGEVVVVGGGEGGEGEVEECGEDENGSESDETELRSSKDDGGETHGACVSAPRMKENSYPLVLRPLSS